MRCPNCGSTSQPKLLWCDDSEILLNYIYKDYKCGCGCRFRIEYAVNAVKVIENEN